MSLTLLFTVFFGIFLQVSLSGVGYHFQNVVIHFEILFGVCKEAAKC